LEELGADVNARDNNGYAPLHHAAAHGDNEMILYLVSKGADVKVVARTRNFIAGIHPSGACRCELPAKPLP
jgi:ankyrin repeat protein